MIELENIYSGMEVWWCSATLSYNGKRLSSAERPKKYKIENYTPGDMYLKLVDPEKAYNTKNVYLKFYGQFPNNTVYATEAECKEGWNSIIYNFLDRVESDYQAKKKNLLSKLL